MADETTDGMKGRDAASNSPQNTGNPPSGGAGAPQNPLGAPSSVPPGAPSGGAPKDIGNDIAQILKDVKLPERREDAPGASPKQAPAIKDIDTLLSGAPPTEPATPAQPAAPAEPPAPTQEIETSKVPPTLDSVQSLHTLKQDLQQVVRDQKISVVRAAALEQEKTRTPETIVAKPRSNRVKNAIFASFVLLFLGAAALGGVYIVVLGRATPLPEQPTNSLVFAEQTVSLAIDGQSPLQLKNLLAEARGASSGSLGSITRIAPLKAVYTPEGEGSRLATLTEFFAAIGAKPPADLMRALSEEFFFGLHTVDKNAPLLVIPVLSYDRAFAGMLAWEATMNADLAPMYARVPDLVVGSSGLPERRPFSDVVMRNYDVRALTDDSGAVVLFYSFPTRDTLIIAESPYTFTELLSRLQAQRKL